MRIPSGTSIAEPGSVVDEESGRTYFNHNTGKYFFPNDAVSKFAPSTENMYVEQTRRA